MNARRIWRALGAWERRGGESAGTSAIEMALVLPVLASLWMGLVELDRYVEAARKVMSAAQNMADLVAQDTAYTTAQVTSLMTAARLIMDPLDTTAPLLKVTVGSVGMKGSAGTPTVLWTVSYGAPLVIDPDEAATLAAKGECAIAVHVSYTYVSPFNYLFSERYLEEAAYARPRIARCIALDGVTGM